MSQLYTTIYKGNDGFYCEFKVDVASFEDACRWANSTLEAVQRQTIEKVEVAGVILTSELDCDLPALLG